MTLSLYATMLSFQRPSVKFEPAGDMAALGKWMTLPHEQYSIADLLRCGARLCTRFCDGGIFRLW